MAFAALVIILLTVWWMDVYTRHGDSVKVPDLKNIRIDKAVEILEEQDFRYKIIDSVFREDIKKMAVAEQDPIAGSKVKEGRMVYLVINSLGKPQVKMPFVEEKSATVAKLIIESAGLKVGRIDSMKSELGTGFIIMQKYRGKRISPNTMIEKGSFIDLTVSVKSYGTDSTNMDNFAP